MSSDLANSYLREFEETNTYSQPTTPPYSASAQLAMQCCTSYDRFPLSVRLSVTFTVRYHVKMTQADQTMHSYAAIDQQRRIQKCSRHGPAWRPKIIVWSVVQVWAEWLQLWGNEVQFRVGQKYYSVTSAVRRHFPLKLVLNLIKKSNFWQLNDHWQPQIPLGMFLPKK